MENRPIKDLSVPGLKRRGISITNSTTDRNLDEARILKDPAKSRTVHILFGGPTYR